MKVGKFTLINKENVVDQLLQHVPEFEERYQQYYEYWGDGFSTFLLFGVEMLKFILETLEECLKISNLECETVKAAMQFVELCALSEDKELVEIIRTGFLESIRSDNRLIPMLISNMGMKTRSIYDKLDTISRPG